MFKDGWAGLRPGARVILALAPLPFAIGIWNIFEGSWLVGGGLAAGIAIAALQMLREGRKRFRAGVGPTSDA